MSAPVLDCHRTLPSTAPAPLKDQTTELVVINSTAPRGGGIGPYARVLKRVGNKYMLPRSPESPTLQMQERRDTDPSVIPGISGSRQARRTAQYAPIQVDELTVEPFQVAQTLLPSTPRSAIPSSRSPTEQEFPNIQVNLKHINVCRAPTFSPLDKRTSSFSQLLSLDMLPALGLAEDEFWKLFSKCAACHNFMTTRTVPYHICPGSEAESGFDIEIVPKAYFLRLLDAHDVGHEAGVPEGVFRAIFYTCEQCGRVMTERVSFDHNEADFDSDIYDQSQSYTACIYLRACVESTFNAHKNGNLQRDQARIEFPTLESL